MPRDSRRWSRSRRRARAIALDGCAADVDGDGDTDLADLLAFQAAFTGAR